MSDSYGLMPIWLPILLSAVGVFLASFLVHMVIRWHQTDEKAIPNEDAVMDALRGLPAGEYRFPHFTRMEEFNSPAFQEKMKRGPMGRVGVSTGDFSAGFRRALIIWFVYCLVVSFVAGHAAFAALGRAAGRHVVAHTVFLAAFAAYGLGPVQQSIWGPKKWWPTIKTVIDAVLYGAVTAAVFVWLWPK